MSRAIPVDARPAIDSYLARLDDVLPGLCAGAYLNGSIALGDWRPGRSDLDVLTVITRALTGADLEALAGLLADREPAAPSNAEAAVWGLLGPGRLHYTINTGAILAKTAAADYTARCFPAFQELLARAKAWRLGDDSVAFTTADGLATCDLVDAIVKDAA
jgi:Domain of unknown function (DUF4111)